MEFLTSGTIYKTDETENSRSSNRATAASEKKHGYSGGIYRIDSHFTEGNDVKRNMREVVHVDFQKYIDKLDQDRHDMEVRLREESQASEQRFAKSLDGLEQKFANFIAEDKEARRQIEQRMDARIEKLDDRIEKLLDKMDKETDKISGKIDGMRKWVLGISLTAFLGIAAMIITVIFAVVSLIS